MIRRWMTLALIAILTFSVMFLLSQLRYLRADLTSAEQKLSDWPNLSYHAQSNEQLPEPSTDEQRVVFIGDSITALWPMVSSEGFFPGKSYINRGIGGQTTHQILLRFRQDVISLRPKVVIIAAGTNDLAGNTGPMTLTAITNNYESMAELAIANQIKIIFASLLPVHDQGYWSDGQPAIQTEIRPPEKIRALNRWLKMYAQKHGYTFLDYYSAMVDSEGLLKTALSEDGLHPNSEGYEMMILLAEQAIQLSLKGNL